MSRLASVTVLGLVVLASGCSGGASAAEDGATGAIDSELRRLPSLPDLPPVVPIPVPPAEPSDPLYVGDASSVAIILSDEKKFWDTHFWMSAQQESDDIDAAFASGAVPVWEYGMRTSALVQMYDLLAPMGGEPTRPTATASGTPTSSSPASSPTRWPRSPAA